MAAPSATRLAVRYRLIDTDATNPLLADSTTLDNAISAALKAGYGTPDLKSQPNRVTTTEMGNLIRAHVENN